MTNEFWSKVKGYFTLGSNINKLTESDAQLDDSSIGDYIPELELKMKDSELIELSNRWEKDWKEYYEKNLKAREDDNEAYWLGTKYSSLKGDAVDNIVFEATETFLPIITKKNPEPLVFTDNTEEGLKLSSTIRDFLVDIADRTTMRLKIRKMARFSLLYLRGIIKVAWDAKKDDIALITLRPQNVILEKDSYIDEGGTYTGEYIGEYKSDKAYNLVKRFPNKKQYITDRCNGKMGTNLNYSEWWTNEYVFWKMDKEILMKIKNPHWNYGETKTTYDEYGNEVKVETAGRNHFPYMEMPYVFLSIFNLGKHPHDETSQIEQSKYLQDLIYKRNKQIEINNDNINGGVVVNGEAFDKSQASEASKAFRTGGTIRVPNAGGQPIGNYIQWMQGTPLPQNAYQQLIDARDEIRNIFGTRGSTPQGIKNENTVRGKIIVKGQDYDRASTPVDFIEQVSDKIFNWFMQMIMVYYDEERSISLLGDNKTISFISLKSGDIDKKVRISVKEGSLIPKDPLTKRNEAIDLWGAGALDPVSLYTALDFPDPQKATERLITWQTNPIGLINPHSGAMQMPMQQAGVELGAVNSNPEVMNTNAGQMVQGQNAPININQEVPI